MFRRTLGCLFLVSSIAIAQPLPDSTEPGYRPYSSFGFSASSVSGLGLSYRKHFPGPGLIQFTGGVISGNGTTASSFGVAYQYQLSKKDNFRYYIASGVGVYSSSNTNPSTVLGLGIGIEVPGLGSTIFESVTAGGELYYPTFYLGSHPSITFGGSIYVFYNF
jgi:hypothetical protein